MAMKALPIRAAKALPGEIEHGFKTLHHRLTGSLFAVQVKFDPIPRQCVIVKLHMVTLLSASFA